MVDGKSGPVKPPVLDLKARPAESKPESGEAKPAPAAEAPKKPAESTPRSPAPEPERGGFAFGAAVAGGVLGLAAAYGLAWFGLWPSAPAGAPPVDPRLARFEAAIPELQTVTETTQSELAVLNQRIAGLESGAEVVAGAPADAGTVEADLAALAARVDALGAAPAPEAGVDPEAIAAVQADLAALDGRVSELGARLGTAEASVGSLGANLADAQAALEGQPTDIGAVLQLPLILSGFEAAFTSGRPYETELAALRAAVPDGAVPTVIANSATTGLARPDTIATRFAEVLPAMLAGRPANAGAAWQDGALDWFRSAIALRPTGAVEGDDPEAVASRLEAAIARRDFGEAETLLASLPVPMVTAAEEVPVLVGAQAEAGRFLEALRAQALSGQNGVAP